MLKGIDWQLIAFIGGSLLQDYVRFRSLPRMIYFSKENEDEAKDGRVA